MTRKRFFLSLAASFFSIGAKSSAPSAFVFESFAFRFFRLPPSCLINVCRKQQKNCVANYQLFAGCIKRYSLIRGCCATQPGYVRERMSRADYGLSFREIETAAEHRLIRLFQKWANWRRGNLISCLRNGRASLLCGLFTKTLLGRLKDVYRVKQAFSTECLKRITSFFSR